MRQEWFARVLLIVFLALAAAIPAAGWWQKSQGVLIHARMAETGGWTPENLTVTAGEPLRLRLTSDDVTHGFAVGQSDQLPVDIHPGEVTEITLVFDKPGKYTFYCTRWCSINHWRMRGVIEVLPIPGQEATPETGEQPLYVQLGLDIDKDHAADVLPVQKPSASRGAALAANLPQKYLEHEYYLSYAPAELWKMMRKEAALQSLTDQSLWDLVAYIWRQNMPGDTVLVGEQLYQANCSACHGEEGRGDGVFADELSMEVESQHTAAGLGEMTIRPTDFSDPEHMLGASPAHLQGKIIRGGMGTGMPYWGPIFTEEQTWALVAYLWTFQFEMEEP